MDVTVDHIIQSVYEELSSQPVEKYRMIDVIRSTQVSKSTVYYYFDDLEEIYKEVFERLIFQKILQKSQTFDEMVFNFVLYIADNKTFCLNLYQLTMPYGKRQYINQILNEHLWKYKIKNESTNLYLMIGLGSILQTWFEDNLGTDLRRVLIEVQAYNRAIQKAWI